MPTFLHLVALKRENAQIFFNKIIGLVSMREKNVFPRNMPKALQGYP
jgi:hypothetical protein